MEIPATSPNTTGVRKEIILLIELDRQDRERIQRLLEGQGFPVVAVESFNDAVDIYKFLGREVKLIIADAATPGIDYPEISRDVSSVEAELLLLLEKESNPSSGVNLKPLSVPFLHKPIHREELLGRVRRILG